MLVNYDKKIIIEHKKFKDYNQMICLKKKLICIKY